MTKELTAHTRTEADKNPESTHSLYSKPKKSVSLHLSYSKALCVQRATASHREPYQASVQLVTCARVCVSMCEQENAAVGV